VHVKVIIYINLRIPFALQTMMMSNSQTLEYSLKQ
jgi:hypothetical protein